MDAASVTGDNTTSDLLQPPVMQVLSLMQLQGVGSAVKQRATSSKVMQQCNGLPDRSDIWPSRHTHVECKQCGGAAPATVATGESIQPNVKRASGKGSQSACPYPDLLAIMKLSTVMHVDRRACLSSRWARCKV